MLSEGGVYEVGIIFLLWKGAREGTEAGDKASQDQEKRAPSGKHTVKMIVCMETTEPFSFRGQVPALCSCLPEILYALWAAADTFPHHHFQPTAASD